MANEVLSGLIEGRIVHFVLNNGEHRPAIIVKVWEAHRAQGTVNMVVFLDGSNDGMVAIARVSGTDSALLAWKTSIRYSESKESGTWHWIEKA